MQVLSSFCIELAYLAVIWRDERFGNSGLGAREYNF